MNPVSARRLAVDPDYLLKGSSLALECLLDAVRRRPWLAASAVAWIARGRKHLLREAARHSDLDAAALPYRAEAVEELRRESSRGARVVIVSSAGEAPARKMAGQLGFESGEGKADEQWQAPRRRIRAGAIARALRPRHWLKNTLVFLPFLLAHEVGDLGKWQAAGLLFAAFSLLASAGYLWNDLLDRAQDRRHPRRSLRPIASGELPVAAALWLPAVLIALAAACCALLPPGCALLLAAYTILTAVYSIAAKRLVMADVLLLAGLYLLRLLAGSVGTGNVVSHWLMAFALTLFLSLALWKRVSELMAWKSAAYDHAPGRGYRSDDAPVLEMMAVASGFLACLIMVLYIQSPEILRLYRRPEYLWVGVVALLYWLGRLAIYAHRGDCPDDPLLFAVQDRTTLVVFAAAAGMAILAV